MMENKVRGELRKINLALSEIQINAQKCCDSLESFSFLKFETSFFPKKVTVTNLQSDFDSYIKELEANEQIGTALCKPITTYYARHSFATILKNSGVSTKFISEALGHTSLQPTKNYLAGFEQEAIKKTTDVLTSFKNKLKIA